MSSDVVIRAEGLGKKYMIGHEAQRERYTALRDVIARKARNWKRSAGDLFSGRPNVAGDEVEEFWALKDVSFEIKRGEVVGVIGRNGAGKSTLLKILSRITEPSTGRVEIKGRVASLLEVGTGFHPELSGRENIYLNGAILGMTRAEIKRKFDEIVDFAEVEKFLDTPVKRYSSGMYVRLAFAVAAHLEPEILVVDEVLAVGDVAFQKKCIGKMSDVAKGGRTVLFVSHNMPTVRSLCESVILMDKGAIEFQGDVVAALNRYRDGEAQTVYHGKTLPFAGSVHVARCTLEAGLIDGGTVLSLLLRSQYDAKIAIHVFIKDYLMNSVGVATVGGLGMALTSIKAQENELLISLRTDRLAEGRYFLSIRIDGPQRQQLQYLDNVLVLDHHPPLVAGYGEALRQEWGYGCLHMESSVFVRESSLCQEAVNH